MEATKFDNVELFLVDLASYASVNAFCEKVEKEVPRLDILVQNAAVAQGEFVPTPDGWEQQYVLERTTMATGSSLACAQTAGEPPCNSTTFDPPPSVATSNYIQGYYSSFGLCYKFCPLLVPTPQTADL